MSDQISVAHAGYRIALPESLYFDAVPFREWWPTNRPKDRKVQVRQIVLDGWMTEPRILAYGGWYRLDGKLSSQHWNGGGHLHWTDIPMAVRSEIRQQARQQIGLKKWWRS